MIMQNTDSRVVSTLGQIEFARVQIRDLNELTQCTDNSDETRKLRRKIMAHQGMLTRAEQRLVKYAEEGLYTPPGQGPATPAECDTCGEQRPVTGSGDCEGCATELDGVNEGLRQAEV